MTGQHPPLCPCPLCLRANIAHLKAHERELVWCICTLRDAMQRGIPLTEEEANRIRLAILPTPPRANLA